MKYIIIIAVLLCSVKLDSQQVIINSISDTTWTGALNVNGRIDQRFGESEGIAIGQGALKSDNAGVGNIAIGKYTLPNANSALKSVAIGDSSLYSVTSGDNNIAIGYAALRSLNGTSNIAIGRTSLYAGATAFNIAIGGNAGFGGVAFNNTIIGYEAGFSAPISNNTFIGYQSGRLNTGSGNVFIGKESGENETGSDKLYIENSASTTPLIYGDFSTDALTINGSLKSTGRLNIPAFTPSGPNDAGSPGDIAWDANYIYWYTSEWKRVAYNDW